jgi:hypothetical protein
VAGGTDCHDFHYRHHRSCRAHLILGASGAAATAGTRRLHPHAAGRRLVAPLHRPGRGTAGLIAAIDNVHGPITRLILTTDGWGPRPRRLTIAGRRLRLGYFASQPTALLTARCDNGDRVDLLVVPPHTASSTAETAMTLAATASNRIHAQHLLAAATRAPATDADHERPEQVWESEGGHLHTAGRP